MASIENVQELIERECDRLKEMLLEKNRAYGNSALEPLRLFSCVGPEEQIRVRIDDKLSRIRNMSDPNFKTDIQEDAVLDLMGYLVLLRVAHRLKLHP